ncbi:MAG: (Fe-S)-binding protein [Thermoplasmatota archaeon]
MRREELDRVIERTGAFNCVECGKCTSLCPVTKYNPDFAPRLLVVRAQEGLGAEAGGGRDLWTCLTCARCSAKCPYKVKYNEFVRAMREDAFRSGAGPICSEGGLLRTLSRLQTRPWLRQRRLGWLTPGMRVQESGETALFVGCAPYFDKIFGDKHGGLLDSPRAAVRILNGMGVAPVVSAEERCCGHDLYWTGDTETFERLARLNISWLKRSGVKTVVVSCPEGFRTLLKEYPKVDPGLDLEVLHISEYLADALEDGRLKFTKEVRETVTYHDGCRLGRHIGVVDEPRMLLEKVPGLKLVEMESSGEDTACCGVSAFAGCDACSKQLQVDRLRQARKTGATKMLSFCPKCQIHFRCCLSGDLPVRREEVEVEVIDFLSLLERAI